MTRLVLAGGGHAQLAVLASLAERPLPAVEVRLVTPYRRQIYSGMLAGWVAGHYPLPACAIALDALAARARVAFQRAAVVAVDPARGALRCDDGSELGFDLLSIDTGPVAALDELPGSRAHALPIRPIEGFVAAWPALLERLRGAGPRFELLVLGSGAAGVELAFAIGHRARVDGCARLRLTLAGPDALPLDGAPTLLRRRAAARLAERGIGWAGGCRAERIEPGRVRLASGAAIGFDACLLVTGAAAPAWPRAAGLATDERGFVRVGPTLQSRSHPAVFAAGDIAAYAQARPKSGVFAVRAGPTLAHNLRACCEGRALDEWHPQRRALALISSGERHAFAAWGPWAWSGRWVWDWKDRIDRRFVRRFATAG